MPSFALGDGSVIEVSDRSQFSLTRNGLGTTIHLDHGNIIVQAASRANSTSSSTLATRTSPSREQSFP